MEQMKLVTYILVVSKTFTSFESKEAIYNASKAPIVTSRLSHIFILVGTFLRFLLLREDDTITGRYF